MASALPPPSVTMTWPKPNYIDPPSRKLVMLAVEIPLLTLTFGIVIMRLISRYFLSKIAIDDWIMLLASIGAIVLMVLTIIATQFGWLVTKLCTDLFVQLFTIHLGDYTFGISKYLG